MLARHDHQVVSLVEASGVPSDVAEALLSHMEQYRPDLDACQQWVDDLTALDQDLPSTHEQLREGDDAHQLPPKVGDLARWIFTEACPVPVLESAASHIKAVLEATAELLPETDPERRQIQAKSSSPKKESV